MSQSLLFMPITILVDENINKIQESGQKDEKLVWDMKLFLALLDLYFRHTLSLYLWKVIRDVKKLT